MSDVATKTKRRKKANFKEGELRILVENVVSNQVVLFSALCSTVHNDQKKKIWTEIAEKINASSTEQRNAEDIRKKWQDLRFQTKKRMVELKTERNRTGGGPPPTPLNSLEEQVASTIPECAVSGIEGGMESSFDTDIPSPVTEQTLDSDTNILRPATMPSAALPEEPICSATEQQAVAEQEQLHVQENPMASTSHSSIKGKGKRASVQQKSHSTDMSEAFITLKRSKMETQIEHQSEMLILERRKTEALEKIASSLAAIEAKLSPESQSFSLSPIIKLY